MTLRRVGTGNALDFPQHALVPAVRINDLVITGGVVPIDPVTGGVIHGDIRVQTTRALENLDLVLRAAGASLSDVASVDVVLADIERDYERFNEVFNLQFARTPPARRTIGARLALPALLVELSAVAQRADDGDAVTADGATAVGPVQ